MPAAKMPTETGDFRDGWKVRDFPHEGWHVEQRIGMLDCKPTDVEAVENHAEQGEDGACQQSARALANF